MGIAYASRGVFGESRVKFGTGRSPTLRQYVSMKYTF
jgi:hypothetical protein